MKTPKNALQFVCYQETTARFEIYAPTEEAAEEIAKDFFVGREPGSAKPILRGGVNYGKKGNVLVTTERWMTPLTLAVDADEPS